MSKLRTVDKLQVDTHNTLPPSSWAASLAAMPSWSSRLTVVVSVEYTLLAMGMRFSGWLQQVLTKTVADWLYMARWCAGAVVVAVAVVVYS